MCDVETVNKAGDTPLSVTTPFMKLTQADLGRSKNPSSEMYSLVQIQRRDVFLIQEPHARTTGTSHIVGGLEIGLSNKFRISVGGSRTDEPKPADAIYFTA